MHEIPHAACPSSTIPLSSRVGPNNGQQRYPSGLESRRSLLYRFHARNSLCINEVSPQSRDVASEEERRDLTGDKGARGGPDRGSQRDRHRASDNVRSTHTTLPRVVQ